MDKTQLLTQAEWQVMELLWKKPHTLTELVAALGNTTGWSKSTVATMVRRMETKGIISHTEGEKAKLFHPAISQSDAALRETRSLLDRAYHGSVGMMVSTLARRDGLTKEDIDELYAILRKAEEDAK